jgi:hypothetical protein
MTRHRSPKARWINHIVTLREEEVPEEGRVVVETLCLEEGEEVEEGR